MTLTTRTATVAERDGTDQPVLALDGVSLAFDD
jgi:hypothetical protein